jgi:hypothetical protein
MQGSGQSIFHIRVPCPAHPAASAAPKNVCSARRIAKIIVDSAFKIHTTLGPGLFESVYERILAHELEKRGLPQSIEAVAPVTRNSSSPTFASPTNASAC